MFFGQDISQVAFVFMVAVAVGGMALAIFFPALCKCRRIEADSGSNIRLQKCLPDSRCVRG